MLLLPESLKNWWFQGLESHKLKENVSQILDATSLLLIVRGHDWLIKNVANSKIRKKPMVLSTLKLIY